MARATPEEAPLSALVAAVTVRASELKLQLEADPAVLQHDEHQAALLLRALGAEIPQRSRDTLPSKAFLLGKSYAIRLVELPSSCTSETADSLLSVIRATAAVDRSHLEGIREHDLYYFLVAPPGTSDDPFWSSYTQRILRDERACRKLVWSPPVKPGDRPNSARQFLSRTFLARPWHESKDGSLPDLDLVGRIAVRAGLPAERVQKMVAQSSQRSSPQEIVESLLGAIREHT